MKKETSILSIAFCAIFTALIAAGAFIRIPIPIIPFTLQTFFVVLSGMLLGAKGGGMSALAYMLLGLTGIPVFTQGGGIGYIFKPSFGYIIGFVFGAMLAGYIVNKKPHPTYRRLILAGFSGLAVIYAVGVPYFYCICNFYIGSGVTVGYVMLYGFLVTIPGDAMLVLLAAFIAKRLYKYTSK